MCGIVAIFAQQQQRVLQHVLKQAAESLSHRGPDYRRTWLSTNERAGLGHARLSIIDLTTGDQPIPNEDESLQVVVNGEIYDYQTTQKELQARGHRLRTMSDSEVIVHLYEEKGIECLEDLRGEFAFALWDDREQRLFAARDRFGVKPLYYAVHNGVVYLASEMKAIFAAGVPAEWDHEGYYQHLFFSKNLNRTLFKGVYELPPAHYLIANGDGVTIAPYWDCNYPVELEKRSDEEWIEEVRHVLEEAVRIRMIADVPVGSYLSGGLDSSTVFGVASSQAAEPLNAFTVTFDHEAYDETPVARNTANHFGAVFNSIPMSHKNFADHISDTVWHCETMGINANGVARYLQSRALRDAGYRVVLSGDGGDELFAGYIYSRIDMLKASVGGANDIERMHRMEEMRKQNPAFANLTVPRSVGFILPGISDRLGHAPNFIQAVDNNRQPLKSVLSSAFENDFGSYEHYANFMSQFDVEGQLDGRDPVKQALYLWNKSVLPNQVLYADRLDMAHGVEVRTPLFDHKLFETVRKLPTDLLIRNMQEKFALREAGKPYLTDEIYRREKQPFFAPHSTRDPDNKLFEMIQDTVRSESFKAIPFFDQKKVLDMLDRIPSMEAHDRLNHDAGLMLILTTAMIQKRFMDAKLGTNTTV